MDWNQGLHLVEKVTGKTGNDAVRTFQRWNNLSQTGYYSNDVHRMAERIPSQQTGSIYQLPKPNIPANSRDPKLNLMVNSGAFNYTKPYVPSMDDVEQKRLYEEKMEADRNLYPPGSYATIGMVGNAAVYPLHPAIAAPGAAAAVLPQITAFGGKVLDIVGRLASKVYATVGMVAYPTALGQSARDEYKALRLDRITSVGDDTRMRSDSGVPADSTASVPESTIPPTPPAPKKPDGKKPWGWRKRTAVGAAVLGATGMAIKGGTKLFTSTPDKEPSGMGISGTSLASADSLARQAAFGAPGLTEKELAEGTYGYRVRGWATESPVSAQFQKFPMNTPFRRFMGLPPKKDAYIYQENKFWKPSFQAPAPTGPPAVKEVIRYVDPSKRSVLSVPADSNNVVQGNMSANEVESGNKGYSKYQQYLDNLNKGN